MDNMKYLKYKSVCWNFENKINIPINYITSLVESNTVCLHLLNLQCNFGTENIINQREGAHCAVYYSSLQDFIMTFSYLLA